jgi:hypothetical protein
MVSLNIKCSTGTKLTITAELDKTVSELKAQLQADVGVPPEQMRLIYAGRVLKDPQTLASYNIEDGHTVHLVQGAAAPAASVTSPPAQQSGPTATPPGISGLASAMAGGGGSMNMQQQMMQDPEMMREMMNSPMMQSLMSNPELMRTIIQSNPQMQAIIEQNPEIGHVLNDPAVLRQTLEVARSPELMREMMRTTDRAMSNIESHPEGFNMLRRMYHNVQEPLMDAATGGRNTSEALQETAAPAPDPDNPFAELFVVGAIPCVAPSNLLPFEGHRVGYIYGMKWNAFSTCIRGAETRACVHPQDTHVCTFTRHACRELLRLHTNAPCARRACADTMPARCNSRRAITTALALARDPLILVCVAWPAYVSCGWCGG